MFFVLTCLLTELRGELAGYKDAAKRLEMENNLLKHNPRLLTTPRSFQTRTAKSHQKEESVAGNGAIRSSVGGAKMESKRQKNAVPAHIKAEAAAIAEAERLAAAIRSTPCKPRPPKHVPQPHPCPQQPHPATKDPLSDRPPWMGMYLGHVSICHVVLQLRMPVFVISGRNLAPHSSH
jgi:hypothetical protein